MHLVHNGWKWLNKSTTQVFLESYKRNFWNQVKQKHHIQKVINGSCSGVIKWRENSKPQYLLHGTHKYCDVIWILKPRENNSIRNMINEFDIKSSWEFFYWPCYRRQQNKLLLQMNCYFNVFWLSKYWTRERRNADVSLLFQKRNDVIRM
jgi:hypothetical protein